MTGIAGRTRGEERSCPRALLAACLALGLTACSDRATAPATPASASSPAPIDGAGDPDTYAIGFEAGLEQGYADGHDEGVDEGYDKGLEEGRDEGRSAALECVRQHATTTAVEAADLCE